MQCFKYENVAYFACAVSVFYAFHLPLFSSLNRVAFSFLRERIENTNFVQYYKNDIERRLKDKSNAKVYLFFFLSEQGWHSGESIAWVSPITTLFLFYFLPWWISRCHISIGIVVWSRLDTPFLPSLRDISPKFPNPTNLIRIIRTPYISQWLKS